MSTAITKSSSPLERFKEFAKSDIVMSRFSELMGDRQARAYISSVILAVASNDRLQSCSHASIISAAIRAASLKLSCDPATGQAYIVPYGREAAFIPGYKGLRDMAVRTNQYRYIHVDKVFEGEQVETDRLTGETRFQGGRTGDTIIGWIASYEMLNGFRKSLYMTCQEIHDHAKEHNPAGYQATKGIWQKNPHAMERKTVLRILLTQWAMLDAHDTALLIAEPETDPELEMIESEFIYREVELENESDLLRDMGYQAPPSPPEPYLNGHGDQPQPEPVPEPAQNGLHANAHKKSQAEQHPKSTGNGARPLAAPELKERLHANVLKLESAGKTCTPQQRNMIAVNMETCFAPNDNSTEMRKTTLHYLCGVDSVKKLSDAQVLALRAWLNVYQDSGGEWMVDGMACREANAAYNQALLEQGQAEMFV